MVEKPMAGNKYLNRVRRERTRPPHGATSGIRSGSSSMRGSDMFHEKIGGYLFPNLTAGMKHGANVQRRYNIDLAGGGQIIIAKASGLNPQVAYAARINVGGKKSITFFDAGGQPILVQGSKGLFKVSLVSGGWQFEQA